MKHSPTIIAGFLFKKGEKGPIKSWKKRWFVVFESSPGMLKYFKRKEDFVSVGEIHLNNINFIKKCEPLAPYKWVFMIDEKRSFMLATESEEERLKWLSALENLIEDAKRPQSLFRAVETNDTETSLQFISNLKEKKDDNNIDEIYCFAMDCRTVLHIAVMNKNLTIIKALLHANADINVTTKKFEAGIPSEGGKTPLDYAIWRGYTEIEEYLLSQGALRGRDDLSSDF